MTQSKRIRVLTGYDSNNKPSYVQVSGKTQSDINDAIVRAYIESGRIWEFMPQPATTPQTPASPVRKTHFDAYAQEWFEVYGKPSVSLGRERSLRSHLKRCCEAFGSFNIEDISVRTVAKVMEQWGQNYAHNTICNLRSTLKRILECAVRDGLIPVNPATDDRIRSSNANKPETTSLSVEQAADILTNLPKLDTLQQQTIIALYLFTGIRREELLGLKWEDINLEQDVLHVERAVVYYRGVQVKETKTKKSVRYIPICTELKDLLQRHTRREGFIISSDGLSPINERIYDAEMKSIRSRINLYGAHSREFRRTFATLQLAAGVPLPVVQAMMGHTKATQTLNSYAKVEQHSWENSRNAIFDLIRQHSTKTDTSAS